MKSLALANALVASCFHSGAMDGAMRFSLHSGDYWRGAREAGRGRLCSMNTRRHIVSLLLTGGLVLFLSVPVRAWAADEDAKPQSKSSFGEVIERQLPAPDFIMPTQFLLDLDNGELLSMPTNVWMSGLGFNPGRITTGWSDMVPTFWCTAALFPPTSPFTSTMAGSPFLERTSLLRPLPPQKWSAN
jgi:hypothetical protein